MIFSSTDLTRLLNLSQQIGFLLRECRQLLLYKEKKIKEDRTPVTIVDYSIQVIFAYFCHTIYPDSFLFAEENWHFLHQCCREDPQFLELVENLVQKIYPDITQEMIFRLIEASSSMPQENKLIWVIDPIDGTKEWIKGGEYCVAIACLDQGQIVLSLLICPEWALFPSHKGTMFIAQKNQGAWGYSLDLSCRQKIVLDQKTPKFSWLLDETQIEQHKISSQIKYASVALHKQLYAIRIPQKSRQTEKVWDHAAGSLIVQEAGGVVSDFRGQPLNCTPPLFLNANYGILVASHPTVHQKLLEWTQRYII